jgi:hypothetical protein
MILPPFAGDYNPRFSNITHPYFDDHEVKREHSLQLRLKQLAPLMLDGGRAILWYCHLCQKLIMTRFSGGVEYSGLTHQLFIHDRTHVL